MGMSFYQGSFNVIGEDSNLQTFTIQAPNQESYNYTFGNVGFPFYAPDLRHIPGGTVEQWVN